MSTCIIHPNVSSQQAGAGISRHFLLRDMQGRAYRTLQNRLRKASVSIHVCSGQCSILATQMYLYAFCCRYFGKSLYKLLLLSRRHASCLWKVTLRFLIQVNKADNALPRIALQILCHLLKPLYVIRN